MALLRAENAGRAYGEGAGRREALRDFSLCAERGDFIVITGRSGSGKSTALHLLGAMDRPTSGAVWIDGHSSALPEPALTQLRRRWVGFIFQAFHLLPTLTVAENIELPLLLQTERPLAAAERQRRIAELLAWVELSDRRHARPHELSGGEMQRVALARALVHRPGLVVADEPTGNLDDRNADRVLALLASLSRAGEAAVIMATHRADAARLATEVIDLRDGAIAARVLGEAAPAGRAAETH